jgi:hypothetical protein
MTEITVADQPAPGLETSVQGDFHHIYSFNYSLFSIRGSYRSATSWSPPLLGPRDRPERI